MSSISPSVPISVYFDGHVDNVMTLQKRIDALALPPTWIVNSTKVPITLCELRTTEEVPPRVDVVLTLSIGWSRNGPFLSIAPCSILSTAWH